MSLLVFVRHGSYSKPPKGESNHDSPLTPEGREQAHAAGQFLADLGIVPDLAVSTNTKRTRRTARIALNAMSIQCPILSVPSGWRAGASIEKIEARVMAWASLAESPPDVVMFCGHGVQQKALTKALGLEPIPRGNHAAALVVEMGDGEEWQVVARWDGS